MIHAFPEISLSDAEMDIIHTHLTDPVMVKYFSMLSRNIAVQILQMYCQDEKESKFLRDVAGMQGQLVVLNTLLQTTGK